MFFNFKAKKMLSESKRVVSNLLQNKGFSSSKSDEAANFLVSSVYDAIPSTIENHTIGTTTVIFLALEYGLDSFESEEIYFDLINGQFMYIALENEELNENEYMILNNLYMKLSEDHVNIGGLKGLYKIAKKKSRLNFDDWYSKVKSLALRIDGTSVVEVNGLNILDLLDDSPARQAYDDGLECDEYARILAENFEMPAIKT